jgi:hypothetical protein
MSGAQHSKATNRWGTPNDSDWDIVDRCRRAMRGLDLDVCSEERFNLVVQAPRYYSLLERGEDGTVLPWFGKVLCNPPGQAVREFWEKSLSSDAEQVMWIGFSMEQLGQLADASAHPSDFMICYLRKRIPFTRHDGFEGSPSHANYCCGINVDPEAFIREFGPLGKVQRGPLSI